MSWIRRFKEPFPGMSHLVGALLAIAALVVLLLAVAWPRLAPRCRFAIYGGSLILLYIASAMAHSIHCSPRIGERLDRLDYSAIFLLIAGTYTPICLIPLRGPWGWALLAAIWSLAVVGIWSVWVKRTRQDLVAHDHLHLHGLAGDLRGRRDPAHVSPIRDRVAGGRRRRLLDRRVDFHHRSPAPLAGQVHGARPLARAGARGERVSLHGDDELRLSNFTPRLNLQHLAACSASAPLATIRRFEY